MAANRVTSLPPLHGTKIVINGSYARRDFLPLPWLQRMRLCSTAFLILLNSSTWIRRTMPLKLAIRLRFYVPGLERIAPNVAGLTSHPLICVRASPHVSTTRDTNCLAHLRHRQWLDSNRKILALIQDFQPNTSNFKNCQKSFIFQDVSTAVLYVAALHLFEHVNTSFVFPSSIRTLENIINVTNFVFSPFILQLRQFLADPCQLDSTSNTVQENPTSVIQSRSVRICFEVSGYPWIGKQVSLLWRALAGVYEGSRSCREAGNCERRTVHSGNGLHDSSRHCCLGTAPAVKKK